MERPSRGHLRATYGCLAVIFIVSLIGPHDQLTWFLEAFPVILGVPILYFTRNQLRLTNLSYFLLSLHAIILLIGAHYTYAEVPLSNWLRDHFHWDRNYYDRIGHLAQGFIPAIVAREVLLRKKLCGTRDG